MIRSNVSRDRTRRHRSRGQALVEFALVAPLFVLLLVGIVEAGRFIFNYEVLNDATRSGARYAIVHGANSTESCATGGSTGPAPAGQTSCDPDGSDVKDAVARAAFSLAAAGDLVVHDPRWTCAGCPLPTRTTPPPNSGNNSRGDYVTVFVDFTYDPLLKQVIDIGFLPTITISAESTLVVNN
jgi:hypothetical protein